MKHIQTNMVFMSVISIIFLTISCGEEDGCYVRGYEIEPGADLRKADLREANLAKADLRGANLEGAILEKADLSDAKLKGASFKNALYSENTKFPQDFDPEKAGMAKMPGALDPC